MFNCKKILSTILATTMMVGVGTTAMAKDNVKVPESYTTFVECNIETGEEKEVMVPHYADTPNYTLPSGTTTFEGVRGAELPQISTYNYTSNWAKVSNVNLNPYNGIVQIESKFKNDTTPYVATGFVVANGKVLTVAHEIYKSGKVLEYVKVRFAGNSNFVNVTSYVKAANWNGENDSTNATNDYAILKVPTSGKFVFGLYAGVFMDNNYTISGFPKVKNTAFTGTTLYTDTAKAIKYGIVNGTVYHAIDITIGVSGAPMYGSNNYVVGIQSHGWSDLVPENAPTNEDRPSKGGFATLITQSVIDFVRNA